MSPGRKLPLFLGPHDLEAIHQTVVEKFGVSPEVHNEDAIHQISSEVHYRAFREFSREASLDLFDAAGMYAASVNESKPFLEGNEQTAKLAALTFLKINGVDTSRLPEEKTAQMFEALAAGQSDEIKLAAFMRVRCNEPQLSREADAARTQELDLDLER